MSIYSNIPILGIKKIDAEHKDLMMFLVQLKEGSDGNIDADPLKLAQTFLDYCTHHFENEELYMARQNYPFDESHAHIMEHRRIGVKVKRLMEDFKVILNKDNIIEIKKEFITHMAIYDKMWAEWAEINSPGFQRPTK